MRNYRQKLISAINVHETFKSGLHMYVCKYICTYIHTHVHTYIKQKKSHLIAPLVMFVVGFQSLKKIHNTPPFGKRLHPSHHFLRLIILYLSIAHQSKAANNPKTCLVISLRNGTSLFHMKTSPKKKTKNTSTHPFAPRSFSANRGPKKNISGHICAPSLLTSKSMLLFFKMGTN